MMKEAIGELKILSHMDRICWAETPITADVFLTERCNNKCFFCTYSRWGLKKDSDMRYEDFVRYARRLLSLGVKGIILTGGGEPTVAEDFPRICKWLENEGLQFGLRYGVNTNFNNYFPVSPDFLKISLDAWDEDSYERIRGVRQYKNVRENIKRYVAWKNENNKRTVVGIQKVVFDVAEIIPFYEANKDLPVDYIVFRPVESTCGGFYAGEDKKKDARAAVNIINGLAIKDDRVKANFKWYLLDAKMSECRAQWAQMALNSHGEVLYCCHKPTEIVGHIMDSDILSKKRNFFTDMQRCDVPCRLTSVNRIVGAISGPAACFL